MTIRLDSDIRPADSAPPYCSSCRQQQVDKRHIDFDAPCDRGYAYGGEVTPNGEPVAGVVPVPLDWLILCEDCLRVAAEQVGMESEHNVQLAHQETDRLAVENERLKDEAKKAQEYADRLEDVFDKRPQKIAVDHRKRPRQRVEAR